MAGPELAGQITWLFPIAAVGAVASAAGARPRRPLEPEHLALLTWGGWLGCYAIAFSFARGIIHPYYMVLLAPPMAALVGIGVTALWRISRRGGWGLAALPTALILTTLWQARVLAAFPGWPARLLPFLAGGIAASVTGLVGAFLLESRWASAILAGRAALGVGLLAVLLAPLVWSLTPVLAEGSPIIPIADPALLTGVGVLAPPLIDPTDIRPLVDLLQAHRRGERYLLATSHLMVAALIIVETGQPVITTTGFMNTEPTITPAKFEDMVARRQVRYALLYPSPGGPRGGVVDRGPGGSRIVSPALWRPRPPGSKTPVPAVDGPRKAPDPRVGTDASPGPSNPIRMDLQEMNLYDFRPNSENESISLQPGR